MPYARACFSNCIPGWTVTRNSKTFGIFDLDALARSNGLPGGMAISRMIRSGCRWLFRGGWIVARFAANHEIGVCAETFTRGLQNARSSQLRNTRGTIRYFPTNGELRILAVDDGARSSVRAFDTAIGFDKCRGK
jgi:hypothetical protein